MLYGRVAIWPCCNTLAREGETPIDTMFVFLFLVETAVSLPARVYFVGGVVGHLSTVQYCSGIGYPPCPCPDGGGNLSRPLALVARARVFR